MPNHIHNVLIFKTPELYESFKSKYVTHFKGDGEEWDGFDFDRVIPAPKTKEDCPKAYLLETERDHQLAGIEAEYFYDWYEWNTDNWGTKWNTYCNNFIPEKNIIYFDTAWCPPDKIFKTLSYKDHEFTDENVVIASLCEFSGIEYLKQFDFRNLASESFNDCDLSKEVFRTIKELADEVDSEIADGFDMINEGLEKIENFTKKPEQLKLLEEFKESLKKLDDAYEY